MLLDAVCLIWDPTLLKFSTVRYLRLERTVVPGVFELLQGELRKTAHVIF
jgi:hypothetical protein